MEEVWITPAPLEIPRWLDDVDVRDGIRALLKLDQCIEERSRVRREISNMCDWWGAETAAVAMALEAPLCKFNFFFFEFAKPDVGHVSLVSAGTPSTISAGAPSSSSFLALIRR